MKAIDKETSIKANDRVNITLSILQLSGPAGTILQPNEGDSLHTYAREKGDSVPIANCF